MKADYSNPYGTWAVTTEGDVEGRTTNHLGTYTGFIDEIALHLADRCYYSLSFKKAIEITNFEPKAPSVSIQLAAESDTWNLNEKEQIEFSNKLFKNRPVFIEPSNYYASFKIVSSDSENIKKKRALAKLTEEDKHLLGLK